MKGAVCLVVCLFGVVLVVATVPQEGKQGSNETSDRKGNAQTDEVAPEKTGTDVDSNEVKLKNRRSAQELPREKRDNTCDLDRVPSGLTERKAYKHFNFKFFDKHIKDEILNILNSDIAVEIGKIAENSRKDAVGAFDTKGTQDAFRYALTSYRVAEKYGYNTAKAFGDADERTHFRDLPTRLMALHNREVGRCLQKNRSTPEKSEVEVIKDALKSGKLQVVHDTSYDVKWPSFQKCGQTILNTILSILVQPSYNSASFPQTWRAKIRAP
ncbi:uncharacterized protein [Ptychodera flava]|uniref:uncharacterized protein isoform X2 n=1 Tax=Ptychodera flava TaxID=63121 RepID=UPI00396AADAF